MESTNTEGTSSDATGLRGVRQNIQPQSPYADSGLSYFNSSTVPGHALRGLPNANKTAPQSHTIGKSNDSVSPPPNSATTGSSSSPTSPSTGGLSTSGEGSLKAADAGVTYTGPSISHETPSNPLQPIMQTTQDENWGMAVSEGIISQAYDAPPAGVGSESTERNLSQSPSGRYNPAVYPSAIKLLVSNNVAGSIIGRAGQTISELQTQSSARIKLSQTGDFYPGTQDRVCLVQGQIENVKVAVRLLLERLHMLQEQQHTQHVAWHPKSNEASPTGFDFVVRVLVPSSSCGMIIGKAGSNIKHIQETSGVSSVRLSPKESSDPSSPTTAIVSGTSERVVTLTGPTLESCITCLYIVLDGMMANHEICRYTNMTTSYSRVVLHNSFGGVPQGAVPSVGRPVLVVPSGTNPESPMWEGGTPYNQFAAAKKSSSSPDLAAQMLWDQRVATRVPQDTQAPTMSRPPQSRESVPQYTPAFNEGAQSYSQDMAPLMQSPGRGPPTSTNAPLYLLPTPSSNQLDQASMPNSVSAPDLLALQLQESLRINTPPSSGGVDYTHFAPQLPQPTPPGFTAQVLVPDTLIGSILGRGGRTLNELQMHSNTRIRISQRGEYVPGTRNRIVTIRGPSAHSVSLAQYLMSQRMVLPPTASFSPQGPFHPQQPPPQRIPTHPIQQPHLTHRQDLHPNHFQGSVTENAFQSSDAHNLNPPSGPSELPHA